jgi:hypothetical protein
MIAVRNYFPSGCASPNGCDDPDCTMCATAASMHRAMPIEEEKPQTNPERDGAPKLSGEKKRGNLAFEKRNRVGPHR